MKRWLFLLIPLGLAACTEAPPADAYRFEPAPRALADAGGPAPTRHPRGLVDSVVSGMVFMLAVEGRGDAARVVVIPSENGGDSFGAPIPVSAPGACVRSHGENGPRLVAGPDTYYAAWDQEDGIRVSRSVTWGGSFEPPVKVSDGPADSFNGYVSIAVAPDGDLYAVWLDMRGGNPGMDTFSVYLARSTDRGQSFGPNVQVATGVCPCCRPNLTFGPDGELMVFWRKVFPGQVRDMVVAVSRDQGLHFAAPVRIAEDGWRVTGCPDSGIAVQRVGDRIYGAWLTEATAATRGIRFSWTDDGGRTWASPVSASQDVLDANYPSLAATEDGGAILIFQGRDAAENGGWGAIRPFVVSIDAEGRLSKPAVIPGVQAPISRPAIFTGSGGRLYATWTGGRDGKDAVFLARARRAPPAP